MTKEELEKKRQEMFSKLTENRESALRIEGYIACLNDMLNEEGQDATEQSTGVSDTGE